MKTWFLKLAARMYVHGVLKAGMKVLHPARNPIDLPRDIWCPNWLRTWVMAEIVRSARRG